MPVLLPSPASDVGPATTQSPTSTGIVEIGFISDEIGSLLSATREDGLFALSGVLQEPERLTLVTTEPAPNAGYALLTSSAHLVGIRDEYISAAYEQLSDSTRFAIEHTGDGRVWIKHTDSREYLALRADGRVGVTGVSHVAAALWWPVPRPIIGMLLRSHALEAFNGQKVALWHSLADGGWVTATPRGPMGLTGGEVKRGTAKLGGWELFTLEVRSVQSSTVALRTAHDTYVSVTPQGKVLADKWEVGVWETLTVCEDAQGRVAFRSQHGTFISSVNAPLEAKSPVAGPHEMFTLLSGEVATQRYLDGSPLIESELVGRPQGMGSAGAPVSPPHADAAPGLSFRAARLAQVRESAAMVRAKAEQLAGAIHSFITTVPESGTASAAAPTMITPPGS